MPGEFFFMAVGGLGVSLAGFAGLLSTFASSEARSSEVWRWRIKEVVRSGLMTTFTGFGVVALFAVTEDAAVTARVISGLVAATLALTHSKMGRPGPAWPNERRRRTVWAVGWFVVGLVATNIVLGSVGLLHVIMLILLWMPASVFVAAVADTFSGANPGSGGRPIDHRYPGHQQGDDT